MDTNKSLKIKFEIIYKDDKNYYSEPIPPYVYDVFAYMKGTSKEKVKEQWETECKTEFYQSIQDEIIVRDILDELIKRMNIIEERFYESYSVVYIKTDSDYIGIENYNISVQELCRRFHISNTLQVYWIYSKYQGGIWEEGQIQYYMRSHESGSHHRAHVHVNAGHKYDASVDILTGKVLEGKLGKYEKKVIKKVSDNQKFLLQCWNDMTDGLKVDIDYHLKMHD